MSTREQPTQRHTSRVTTVRSGWSSTRYVSLGDLRTLVAACQGMDDAASVYVNGTAESGSYSDRRFIVGDVTIEESVAQ